MKLSQRSLDRLQGVHPALVRVVHKAVENATAAGMDFGVLEGLRTIERQKQLVAKGASKTMNSRHLTGHAVDLGVFIGAKVVWHWEVYNQISVIVKDSAREVNVPIEWGGDWRTFKDGPHFQLPWSTYP